MGMEWPMVGVRGFEPPTPASRTQYSTRLSYTPRQMAGAGPTSGSLICRLPGNSKNYAVRNYGQPRKPLKVAKLIWILNPVMQKLHYLRSGFPAARLRACSAGRGGPGGRRARAG